jgi:hypothetical protein
MPSVLAVEVDNVLYVNVDLFVAVIINPSVMSINSGMVGVGTANS